MKLLILTICVLVLVALANAKPWKRDHRRGYDFNNPETNDENTNEEENNSPYGVTIGGKTNENGPNRKRDHRRGYDYNNPETNDENTNEEENNSPYGVTIGGKTNENGPNRWSDCPNCYALERFGNGHYNGNTINIEKK